MNEIVELKDLVTRDGGEIRFNLNETLLSSDYSFDEVEFNIMTYYGVEWRSSGWLSTSVRSLRSEFVWQKERRSFGNSRFPDASSFFFLFSFFSLIRLTDERRESFLRFSLERPEEAGINARWLLTKMVATLPGNESVERPMFPLCFFNASI